MEMKKQKMQMEMEKCKMSNVDTKRNICVDG